LIGAFVGSFDALTNLINHAQLIMALRFRTAVPHRPLRHRIWSNSTESAAAKLKGIQPKFVLTMPGGASAITALEIVAAKYVKHIGDAQVGEFVGLALFIDEQGRVDSRFFPENKRIVAVPKADGCEGSTFD
jgi:hypothetical protein